MTTYLTYLISWFGLMVVAILNGALRTLGYGKLMSELRAHQISCFTGIALIGFFVWMMTKKYPIASAKQSVLIGLTWLAMTILFEFVFGHYVMKHPWERLLYDYRMDEGRLWILVLLWTALVPYVIYSIQQTRV